MKEFDVKDIEKAVENSPIQNADIKDSALIVQNNIARMNENSGRLKALYLPYIGIILTMMFTLAFSDGSGWFSNILHQTYFGLIMALVMGLSTFIFAYLDYKYLMNERKLRAIYNAFAEKYPGYVFDISSALGSKNNCSRKAGWSIKCYYPIICAIAIVAYFLVVVVVNYA